MSNTELIAEAREQANNIRRDGVEFMKSSRIADDYDALAAALEAAQAVPDREVIRAVVAAHMPGVTIEADTDTIADAVLAVLRRPLPALSK